MFKNYLKTTIRSLINQKTFTAINVIGLALSMVACIIIFRYVDYDRSYDSFHSDNDRLYRIYRIAEGESPDDGVASVFPGMTPVIKEEIPEFEHVARLVQSSVIFQSFALTSKQEEERTFNIERPFFADGDLFNVLSFNWIEGGIMSSFEEPKKVVISSTIAKKFFGDQSALGRVLRFKNLNIDLLVEGVFEDWPDNSHVHFDVICSISTLPAEWNLDNDFGWGNFYTYAKITPGSDLNVLEDKMNLSVGKRESWYADEGVEFKLQAVEDIHLESHHSYELESNGNPNTLFLLTIIGLFIMIIAWVNYVNLSTTKIIDRAKEAGVRKILGSRPIHLIKQYLLEALIINLISILFSITILQITSSYFEDLLGIPLELFSPSHLWSTLLLFLLFAFGGILFGLYPAIQFSKQRLSTVLNSRSKADTKGLLLRKMLTTFQYTIAALLLFATIGIGKQLQFIQNGNLGMNIEQTLIVKKPFIELDERVLSKSTFINRVVSLPNVNSVSASSEIPGQTISYVRWVRLGTEVDAKATFGKAIAIDSAYIDLYEINVLHGRSFSSEFNDEKSIILGLSTAKALLEGDLETWIGKTVYYMMEPYELVGIVDDISQESLKEEPKPHIYLNDDRVRYFSIKLESDNVSETVASVERIFNDTFDSSHYEYFFLDTYFDRQYKSDRLFGEVFRFFSILAIVITSLGLFGLSLYNVNQRSKEICIRKILGAEVKQLFKLLTKEYFIMLGLALIIGLPLGTIFLDKWISGFAQQMKLDLLLFTQPLILLLVLTILTVGYQILKVSYSNPTDILRNE